MKFKNISNYSGILKYTYEFLSKISGNVVAAATKRFLKKRISPAGLLVPEVFVENVGQNIIMHNTWAVTNIITAALCLLSTTHQLSCTITVSQYAPDSFFQKPYFSQEHFANISAIFSDGYAAQAFNQNGQRVPFLQQFGSEDFLQRFTDPSINPHDTTSLGKGQLSGNFQYRQLILSAYKNVFHSLFIEAATSIQDLTIRSITADFIPTDTPLNNDQIAYLEKLSSILPSSINRSGMFTSAFYLGFDRTFTDFTHLDFVDILIKAGVASPEWMHNTNNSIVQFPFYGNLNFGYPIIIALSTGLLDWLTFGCNGTIEPYQPAVKNIAMNSSNSENQILLQKSGLATMNRGPLFSTSMYVEADHVAAGISGTVGYTYTKNLASQITPINDTNFSKINANQSLMLNSWSLGSLYLQLDVDFVTEARPSAPVIAIFCVIPVAGQLCPETNLFGGSCNFQISYAF